MKRLPRLSKSGVLTPAQWDAVARIIEDNFREATIQPGIGYTVKNSPGGASLVVNAGASSALLPFPFQCTVNTIVAEGGAVSYTVSVNLDSHCWSVAPSWRDIPITGLFNPDPASTGYPVTHALTTGTDASVIDDYVMLDIAFDSSGYATSAAIVTQGGGSSVDPTLPAWDSSGNALFASSTDTVPLQTAARIVLAQWQGGQLTQVIRQNLGLYDFVVDGQLASYFRPLY